MIAVIADDFTGAAEIGGIGLRNGLKVVIESEPVQNNDAELLIIATDTRSLPAKEAAKEIGRITQKLIALKPELIFKKIDSVLRGNITEEILEQMKVSKKERAVVIAANPVFKRIIKEGQYFIDELPLDQTCFSTDPQYPTKSSSVLEILNGEQKPWLVNHKSDDILPDNGIIIGDVSGFNDLTKWASQIDDKTLYAGASGFFDAILKSKNYNKKIENDIKVPFGDTTFFILGSTFPKQIDFLKKLEENGHYLSNMPEKLYYTKEFNEPSFNEWVEDILNGFKTNQKVVASILHSRTKEPDIESRIKELVGKMSKEIFRQVKIQELLIEGGSTTSVVLKHLNINKLHPFRELDTGIIRMRIEEEPDMCLTTKPGSYFWPENVWIPEDIKKFNTIAYD